MTVRPTRLTRPRRRAEFVLLAVVAGWSILAGRLVVLQWSQADRFASQARRQWQVEQVIAAAAGDVCDRRGRLLATSVVTNSLYVVPVRIEDPERLASRLGAAAGVDPDRLARRLQRFKHRQFLWVARGLDEAEVERVRRLELPGQCWGFRQEFRRRYPQAGLAAAVLGFRDIDGRGLEGIERSLDDRLRGTPGRRLLERDARGRVVAVHDSAGTRAVPGRDVWLTIDSVIQLRTEQVLDRLVEEFTPRSATAIVIDPRSGDILSMASRPTFDPNDPGASPPEARWNRAIAAVYEPGSTFKPFVVAGAIDRGKLAIDDLIDCHGGRFRMGGRVLHDHHAFGELSVADVLVASSNIGMAQIGMRLTNRGLYRLVVGFGFGRATGISLPGELAGVVRPLKRWTDWSTGSVPMGHEISVTPLQLVTAYAALANGGRLVRPRIVLDGRSPANGRAIGIVTPVVSREVADWIARGPLRDVVRRGTGRRAALPGIDVFGKTGTAQKVDPKTGGYSQTRHIAAFVCGAPAASPRVVVLVLVDEPAVDGPQSGGRVAAPAAAEILRHALPLLPVPIRPGTAASDRSAAQRR